MDNEPQSALKIEELKEGDPPLALSASWINKIVRASNAFNNMKAGDGLLFTRSGDKARIELSNGGGNITAIMVIDSVPKYVTINGSVGGTASYEA